MTTRENHHYLFAIVSVIAMFLGTKVLFWFSLAGGNPYHADPPHIYSVNNVQTSRFHAGDWMIIRRRVCLDREILAEQSPALYDLQRNAIIALPGATVVAAKGCSVRSGMVQIPTNLPPGFYEYRNLSRFQNNLVGRDESNSYPPKMLEVML
jgi:hypothetical protein